MSTIEFVEEFRAAAIEKADGVAGRRDRALHRRMACALAGLDGTGEEGEIALRALLNDASVHVRAWVAAELLSRGHEPAGRVLDEIQQLPGITGFNARITLQQYDSGRLNSPFGV